MKKLLTLVLALALICTACVAMADKTLTFKLAENQPEGNPITDGMYKFAELAKEYTNGTVTIDRVQVNPGDLVAADANGLCFIPAALVDEVYAELKNSNVIA